MAEALRSFAFRGWAVGLKRLRDGLHRLPPTVSYLDRDAAAASRQRDLVIEWRKWYKTARWQKLRWSVLVAYCFTCARCKTLVANTSQLVADHVIAHRGDADLFWRFENLQCLCKRCHDSDKQKEERADGRGWVKTHQTPPS